MIKAVPGIYSKGEYTFEQYKLIDAVNQSTLKAIAKSPLHYRFRVDNELEPTQPMRLGAVAHCACLEHDKLPERYKVWVPTGVISKGKNKGKPKNDDFKGAEFEAFEELAEAEGKAVIKQRELDSALRVRESLWHNPLAARYLKRGIPEVVLVWIDEPTGLPCKARLDWLSLSVADVILELKTARDVGAWSFSAAFAHSGYDVQSAFYHDGYHTLTGRMPGGKCVAIENTEPHDTVVFDLNEVIDTGREIYRGYLDTLVEARKLNRWPGQASEAELILRLPKWRDPSFSDGDADPFADLGLEP